MRKQGLENDPELARMLDREQWKVAIRGSKIAEKQFAPPPEPTREAMRQEREHERGALSYQTERKRVQNIIRWLDEHFDVGGGNMDLRRGSALNAR